MSFGFGFSLPAYTEYGGRFGAGATLLLDFTSGNQTLDSRVTFTRSTTATRTNSSGLIESVAIDAPRFDYNPTTLAPLGLLIEEQRTNLVLQSEGLDTASWTKTSATITANATTAPDGTTTADKLIVDNGVAFGSGFTRQNVSKAASATTYTSTVYAKAGEFNRVRLLCRDAASSANSASVTISLVDGSTVVAVAATGTFTAASSSTISVSNGWYRISLTFTSGTETAIWGGSYIPSDSVATQGNGTSGIFIWGAQLEAGAFPTSYIPTVASQVTRTADVATMTGTNFSSWYNATEGTLYAEWNSVGSLSNDRLPYAISDGTFNNVNYLTAATAAASNQSVNTIRSSNVTQASIAIAGAYTNYAYRKSAAAYKVNDFAICGDGGAVAVDTSGSVPVGVDRLALGTSWVATTNFLNGTIKRIAFYPRRLDNSELQAITS
jgi:hypothetical protein